MHKFLNMQQPAEADALDTTEKFLTSWLHKLQIGVAMKLGLMLVSCIGILLVGASFLLSSYLATQLQDNALEVLRSNTRIFHNNITTEYKRVLRDAERYSNVYINNYQNMSPAPLHSLDENALKDLLNDTKINAHFTELTSVFASTLVREGDQFVRVSSTLQGKEGKIATSTVLSHDNPAYTALLKNKPFSGVVVIYGKQFISHYEPIADKFGQVVGAVAIGFDVKLALQPVIKELLAVHIGEGGYAYVLDAGFSPGAMVAHPTLVNQHVENLTDAHGYKRYADILARKNGTIYYETVSGYGAAPRKRVAVFEYIDGINWIIATTSYVDDVARSSNLVRNSLLLFSLLLMPVILLLIAGTSRILISKRLQNVLKISQSISQGDLTVDIRIDHKDEIGELLSANEKMRASLHALVGGVVSHAHHVHEAALKITEAVDGQASTSVETSSSVAEITSTMEELSASSTQIAEHSRAVVDIANVTLDDCNKGSDSMGELLTRMSDIDSDNQQSMREIMMLGNKSKEISRVMVIINNVADQTKLIAFNAALEASSAGESGKRFSVVAAEIRRLADSVTESTFEIENKISEIQNSINRLVLNAEKGSNSIKAGTKACKVSADRLHDIVATAEQTSTAAMQISLSTQQQKTASNQVVMALREIVVASNYTSQSIKDILSISQDMTQLSEELNQASGSFKLTDRPDEQA
ncbi:MULTISPECIES: methyl-accepting chemotaxis protein [Buttiauxella]|jgi:methyl-accepting chemotaxis protein|uniref:Methyl-accepting chemotaxis protein n=1 Tax=Buttiauxella gaviniae ATCC 51604 TaxID=1354253 RepID=A0A1B7I3H6_9ENTR|nr:MULTISPECIES: Cache 3/Cache 2 fusion domain-containing protein [Buttiauxella]OAT22795.1 methyl-accepting chemotaxis protein [Buttiauxella gaviniae ATCC 51604]TDX17779.1 methyl-accepting chemotaxis protein [Buttiauxella sp. BIGb0552]